jgi:hypothetical protein
MSWQAFEAMRDHSKSRGATRAIGFVLASYANKHGGDVYPGLTAICKGAKVGKKTAIDGRRWFVSNGEAFIIGTKQSHTGTPIPILDFSPLLQKGSESAPLATDEGSPGDPFELEGFDQRTLKGSEGAPSRVRSAPPKGSLSEPEPEGNVKKLKFETEDARAEARGSSSGLSPSSSGLSERPAAHLAAERRDDERELAALEAQLSTTAHRDVTETAIADLRSRLGLPELKQVAA